LLPFQWQGCPL
ncbi:unnamed protein product, partial [Rotaria magnacalcarata]